MTTMNVGQATITIVGDGSSFPSDVDKGARSGLSSVAKNIGQAFSTTFKLAAGAAIGAAGTVLGVAISGGINRAINIENATAKLRGLGHSAETVGQITDDALGAVRGTAYGLGDAMTVAASSVAAGVKPGKDLERTLKLVGDASTIAGVGMGEMGAIFNKVAASNKVQMDVINQLHDKGVPALQLIADHIGVTAEEASKMASSGQIDFDTFRAAIEEGMGGGRQALEALAEQYGVTTDEARQMVKDGTISFDEYQAKIAEFGGAALESGKTFEGSLANMKAALGRMGESAFKPILNASTTAFGTLTESIDKVHDQVKPLLETLGTGVGEALGKMAEKFAGLLDRIDFSKVTDGASKFSGVLAPLAGLSAGLLGPLLAEIPVVGKLFGGLTGPVGAVISAFVMMWQNSETLREAIGNLFTTLSTVFESLSPALEALSSLFNAVAGALGDVLGNAIQTILPFITQLADMLGPFLADALNTLVPLVTQAGDVLGSALGAALESLLPVVLDLVSAALPPLLTLITELAPVVSTLLDAIMPLVSTLLDALAPALEALAPLFTTVIDAIIPLVLLLADQLIPVIEALLPIVEVVFNGMGEIISAVMEIIQGVIQTFTSAISGDWSGAWEGIKATFSGVWDYITALLSTSFELMKSVISAGLSVIGSVWSVAWSVISSVVSNIWNSIKSVVSTSINAVKNTVSSVMDTIKSVWSNAWNALKTSMDSVWTGIKSAVSSSIDNVLSAVSGIKGSILGFFSGAGTWLVDSGKQIIQGLVNGISNMVGAVKNAVGNVLSAARNLLPFSPAKEGPFSGKGWTLYSGQSIVEALGEGIESQRRSLVRTVSALAESAHDALDGGLTVKQSGSVTLPPVALSAAPERVSAESPGAAVLEGPVTLRREDLDYMVRGLAKALWPMRQVVDYVDDLVAMGRTRQRMGVAG